MKSFALLVAMMVGSHRISLKNYSRTCFLAAFSLITKHRTGFISLCFISGWMDQIRVKLVDDKTHQNIKLFLLRLILNCSDAFRPFAKLLGRDLLQLVASSSTWPGGQCVNYFSLDLIVMLLSWQVLSLFIGWKLYCFALIGPPNVIRA